KAQLPHIAAAHARVVTGGGTSPMRRNVFRCSHASPASLLFRLMLETARRNIRFSLARNASAAGRVPPRRPRAAGPSAAFWLAAILPLAGCTQIQDARELVDGDLHPPSLAGAELVDTNTAEIRLNKESRALPESFRLEPAGEIEVSEEPGHTLSVRFEEATEPGTRYTLAGAAEDAYGNSLQFVVYLYGYNPDIPSIQINEFSTRHSSNHPEIVELLVLEDGNLGGVAVTNGTAGDFNDRYVFPGINVSAGDYVLVHFRPEGESYEVNELASDLDESEGLNAHPEARDIWVEGASGLPSNNGVVAVYRTPGGDPLDAVAWTNRTRESDERYRGFGSTRMQNWVDELVDDNAWVIEGAVAWPEDLIYIDDSTATRSMNRTPDAENTTGKGDWHTAPTSGSSWGEENTVERYTP
ncbi:MAG: hypothetical protein ACLFM0_11270, partial [Spirochaetales bacterium]